MAWKAGAAVLTLRDQINERFPKRDKASDGIKASSSHTAQNPFSDHEPNSRGYVLALDIDEDFGAKGDNMRLANQLRELAKSGKDGGRLKYVIYEDKIASGTSGNWAWRGSGYGHTKHIHVSFTSKGEQDGSPFPLPIFDQVKPKQHWDGHVPDYAEMLRASQTPGDVSLASWRLAARLADLGHYKGTPKPRGEQGYPAKAVAAWQESIGALGTGRYGPIAHKRIWGLA